MRLRGISVSRFPQVLDFLCSLWYVVHVRVEKKQGRSCEEETEKARKEERRAKDSKASCVKLYHE